MTFSTSQPPRILISYLSLLLHHPWFLAITVWVIEVLRSRYRQHLRNLPGPWLAKWSSSWRVWAVWKSDMQKRAIALHQRYGPLVRIGPNHVSVCDAAALKEIYGVGSQYVKTSFYSVAQSEYEGAELHNVFSTQNIAYHASLKRAIAKTYNTTAVKTYEPGVDRCILLFADRIRSFQTKEGRAAPFNASAWLHYFAFDALGELNFSRQLGFLERGDDVDGWISGAEEMIRYVSVVGQTPVWDHLLLANPILKWWKGDTEGGNQVLAFALEMIRERQANRGKQEDMLNSLLETHDKDPEKLSFREILAATSINILAGHDTLAITLRAIFYFVARDLRVYHRLQTEIDEAVRDGSVATNPVSFPEASRLQYLQAVIQESMRLHPTIGLILERYVPAGGATLCNVYLPAGTIVGMNAWAIHHERSIYGEDADHFCPERWIEAIEVAGVSNKAERERIAEMKSNLFTFGHGARGCLGRNIAMIQIVKLVFELYRQFDVRLVEPEKEWDVEGVWLTKQTGMDMIFTNRNS